MKVTIKNVNKEVYTFDVTGDEKVQQLKEMIADKHKHQPTWQTLIYSGKILENDKALSTYNITENGFIVCMVKKPKEETTTATTTPAAPTTTQTTTPQAATPAAPTTTPIQPTPTPTATSTPTTTPGAPTPSPASATSPQRDPTGIVAGAEYEAVIKQMEDMGFNRDLIIRALRVSYNNPERAIELLLTGSVPQFTEEEDEGEGDDIGEQQEGEQGTGESNIFSALRNNPSFPEIRATIQRNPGVIPELLQQISQTNPGLVRQITENPQEFIRLFQEPGPQQQQHVIHITPEERAAIDRLIQLTGFEKSEVIAAYFACDKDEQLAAAYLYEQADNDNN